MRGFYSLDAPNDQRPNGQPVAAMLDGGGLDFLVVKEVTQELLHAQDANRLLRMENEMLRREIDDMKAHTPVEHGRTEVRASDRPPVRFEPARSSQALCIPLPAAGELWERQTFFAWRACASIHG